MSYLVNWISDACFPGCTESQSLLKRLNYVIASNTVPVSNFLLDSAQCAPLCKLSGTLTLLEAMSALLFLTS